MLLIIITMQIVAIYFVRSIEDTLRNNFENSILDRVNLLSYNISEVLTNSLEESNATKMSTIRSILTDFV